MNKRTPRIKVAECARLGPDQRGVYACESIKRGETVEISPVMVFDPEEAEIVEGTMLDRYVFEWGDDSKSSAVGLGYISLYNHSHEPNADYTQDFDEIIMEITAVKDIKRGEEITINYNATPDDKTPMWFEEKETIES